MKVALPSNLAVIIEVDLGQTGQAYFLQARLTLRVPGLTQDVAMELATPPTRSVRTRRRREAISMWSLTP